MRARVEDFDFANRVVFVREKKKSRSRETFRTVDMTPLVESVVKGYFADGHPGGFYAFSPISMPTPRSSVSTPILPPACRKRCSKSWAKGARWLW